MNNCPHCDFEFHQSNKPTQIGVMGLLGYLDEIKLFNKNSITRVPVAYENICFFTIRPFKNENGENEKLRTNYLWFCTEKNEYFFMKSSLKDLQKILPKYFLRINESYIVNIMPHIFNGRINGSKLSINKKQYRIKATYKNEVKRILESFYGSL